MKYKLLAVSTERRVNIGDYIQALAAAQFLPKADGFIQREKLKDYDGEECKVIMNGWYMYHTEQWPPSEKIHPLFVAFHINASAKNGLVSKESIDYLKRFQPIGCRDFYTMDLLLSKGIDAYFSACMTLTLGTRYKSTEKDEKCYFVDPYIPKEKRGYNELSNTLWLLTHMDTINKIARKWPYKRHLKKYIHVCRFYRTYIKIFTKETLTKAEYISHWDRNYLSASKTEDEWLTEAERLVYKYSKSKLVVTSRIHCALPCLGLEVPVIFTENIKQSDISRCRMGGIRDLFNIISFNGKKYDLNFNLYGNQRISTSACPANKVLWKKFADTLAATCKSFIAKKDN